MESTFPSRKVSIEIGSLTRREAKKRKESKAIEIAHVRFLLRAGDKYAFTFAV